jgi:hypothetical protein
MSLESVIQTNIRLALGRLRMLFLRYQVGLFYTKDGRPVKIGEVGVSDLIGMVPHVITQEDVGRTIGVFTVMETKQVKDSTDRERKKKQGAFLRAVNRGGGLGAIVRSEEDAACVVTNKWKSPLVKKFSA